MSCILVLRSSGPLRHLNISSVPGTDRKGTIPFMANCWLMNTRMGRSNGRYGYCLVFSCGTRSRNLSEEHWSTSGWHLTTSLAPGRYYAKAWLEAVKCTHIYHLSFIPLIDEIHLRCMRYFAVIMSNMATLWNILCNRSINDETPMRSIIDQNAASGYVLINHTSHHPDNTPRVSGDRYLIKEHRKNRIISKV